MYNDETIQYVPGVDIAFDEPKNAAITLDPVNNGKNPEQVIEYLREKSIFPIH